MYLGNIQISPIKIKNHFKLNKVCSLPSWDSKNRAKRDFRPDAVMRTA